MKKLKPFILLMGLVIALVGCTQKSTDRHSEKENNDENASDENQTEVDKEDGNKEFNHEPNKGELDEQSTQENMMLDFFLPEGSKAHYEGEGNEFAELDIEVVAANDTYVVVDEDNGGALIRTIYSIQQDKIEILSKETIDFDVVIPTIKEIANMEPIDVYLQKPFNKGATFGEWTITETGVSVETPYKKFENAIVIEMKDNDFVNRKYFVQGFGEIKREAIMDTDENEEFIITSLLESLE